MREKNVIRFYMLAMELKNKLRTGWQEIDIKTERLESVAEHIFGTLILAVTLDSEYDIEVDMFKVLKMLVLHELEEILMPDYTIRSNITKEQKLIEGRKAVHEVTNGLIKQSEIEDLFDEFNAHKTKEALFAFEIDKMECDMQSKKYDLEGFMDFEKVKRDALSFDKEKEKICRQAKNPSDIWLETDRHHYRDKLFIDLLDALKEYKEN